MDINLSKNLNMGLSEQSRDSRNSLVEVVLLIVVCALFGWFVILPKTAEVSAKKTTLGQVTDQEKTMSDSLSKLQGMISTLEADKTDVSNLDQALPLDGNTVDLQILINNLGQSVGATVGDVEVTGDPTYISAGNKDLLANPYGATRSIKKLTGSVTVTGTFSQLQSFLEKVESSARIIDVTDLDIGPAPDGSLILKAGINAYYLAAQ